MTDIEELIQKYFDGATSCEEERRLRRFFAEGDVPPHLAVYRPLFNYMDAEGKKLRDGTRTKPVHRKVRLHPHLRAAIGIAAGLLLCLVLYRFLPSDRPESFVVIDGKRYTDPVLMQAKAREAMLNVSFTDEELDRLLFPIEP